MAIITNRITNISDTGAVHLDSVTFSDGSKLNLPTSYPGSIKRVIENPNIWNPTTNKNFGYDIAMSDDYIAISTITEFAIYVYDAKTLNYLYTIIHEDLFSTMAGDQFGYSIDISGNNLIVGITGEDFYSLNTENGAVAIYDLTTKQRKFVFFDPNTYEYSGVGGDNFGYSVAISGNYAAVSTPYEDTSVDVNAGQVYVYSTVTGALLWTIANPNAYSGSFNDDNFGNAISLDGNFLIVGAWTEDDSGGGNSGKAYIYNVTTGALVWTLNNPNAYSTSFYDSFGTDVSISGNYALVGAYNEDDPSGGQDSGKAYIFDVTTGALVWTLNNPNAYNVTQADQFGQRVRIKGNYAYVAATSEDDVSGSVSGAVYVFNVTTGALVATLRNPNIYGSSDSDQFGWSIAASTNYFLISAVTEDYVQFKTYGSNFSANAGAVYGYSVKDFSLVKTFINKEIDRGGSGDSFGSEVAITGDYAIVVAEYEDLGSSQRADAGALYVFSISTGKLLHSLYNPNAYTGSTYSQDNFGSEIKVYGNYVAVSAYNESDDIATFSGKVYIFEVYSGKLITTLSNPNVYSTPANDNFGRYLAMWGDYIACSAFTEDSSVGGVTSGVVYVYNYKTGNLIYTLSNPNVYSTATDDAYGYSMAMNSKYIIIGARFEDELSGSNSGVVYIYSLNNGSLISTILNPNAYSTPAGDFFGDNIVVNEKYLAICARGESDYNTQFSSSGKVYVYDITKGELLYVLSNPANYSEGSGDSFGQTIAINSRFLVVAAPYEDTGFTTSGGDEGAIYIFDVRTGTLLYTVRDPNFYGLSFNDLIGTNMAISENYIILSVPNEDAPFPPFGNPVSYYSGIVYILNLVPTYTHSNITSLNGLEKIADTRIRMQNALTVKNYGAYVLTDPNAYSTSADDYFGWSVDISDKYAVVGAYQEDDSGGASSGKAYIYDVKTGALTQTLNNPNPYSTSASDEFGRYVSVSGNYVAVSAPLEDETPTGSGSGKVYVYNAGTGTLLYTLNNPNAYSTAENDNFGYSVEIYDKYIIVGAWQEEDSTGNNSGKAYIFNLLNGTLLWTLNNPNVYGPGSDTACFGRSVAITDKYAIVGAANEADATGANSGAAYVFNIQTGALVLTLTNPSSYSTGAGDQFGFSVGVSGEYAIVGAWLEEYNGGAVYVYNILSGQLIYTIKNPNFEGLRGGEYFGYSIDTYKNYMIISAPFDATQTGTQSGVAFIFDIPTGKLIYSIPNLNGYMSYDSDVFGNGTKGVAISGNYAIIGAYAEDDSGNNNSGKAYIIDLFEGNINNVEDRLMSLLENSTKREHRFKYNSL